MKDFVSEIKKINTDGLIYKFSEISIEMFKDNQYMRKVEIPVISYGRNQKLIVQLSAWDIPNIAFLSVKESNDYRHADKVSSVGQLVDLYRKHDNEHSAAESIKNAADGVFRVVYKELREYSLGKPKEEQILNKLLDSTKPDGLQKRQNIGAIYEELFIHENQHLDDQMDYFSKIMEHFGNNL